MSIFPQEYAHEFFGTVAIVALIWTIALLVHMSRAWATFTSDGQRLRYLALLYASTLAVVAAVEQFNLQRDVELRNIGTAGFLILLGWAIIVTYREERRRPKKRATR